MDNTGRRNKLAPQALREKMLKRGNKEAGAKTSPSKLSTVEKAKIVCDNYEEQLLSETLNFFNRDSKNAEPTVGLDLEWLRLRELGSYNSIYQAKTTGERDEVLSFYDGYGVKNARMQLRSIELRKKDAQEGKKQRPLARLIAAEERING